MTFPLILIDSNRSTGLLLRDVLSSRSQSTHYLIMKPSYPNAEQVPSLWFPLVKKFYQEHYPSGKPNKADPIWVIKDQGRILCAVRLKQINTIQLLTAMVTKPSHRNMGLGSHLINDIHAALSKTPCYCFAFTHLVPFYTANHFTAIPVEILPEEVRTRFLAYTAQGRELTPMHYIRR
ncbi:MULTISPECIES: GNAT family N-acetyltransferase [Marinomonas]|uniref:GNAT family N-acetyltransferase n=1 Tax=Marinomonas TaxID=28253 RepID=UPI002243A2FD|nr:GNAT family N-acetyltransferase [Marinomonas pontica]MCW8354414.1 GNAT family N-acetyltransferase [Marinomonas pontica]